MKVQDKVAEIAKLCVEITMNTEHDVFMTYFAHVNSVDVRLFNGRWKEDKEWETIDACLGYEDAIYQLNLIIKQLQDLLK